MTSNKRTSTTVQCEHDQHNTTDHHRPSSSSSFIKCADLILPYLTPQELANVSLTSKSLSKIAQSVSLLRSLDAARSFENLPIPFHHHHRHRRPPPPPYSYFLYTASQLLPSQSFCRQAWGFRTVQPAGGGDDGGGECFGNEEGLGPGRTGPGWTGGGVDFEGREDLLGEEEMGMGMRMECGVECECGGQRCRNKLTQGGISVRLKIVWCEKKGWGLFADQSVRRGQFICEYAGTQCCNVNIINLLKLVLLLLLVLWSINGDRVR